MTTATMTTPWTLLLPPALVGTERQPQWPLPLPPDTEAGRLLADIEGQTDDPALRLLRMAAALAVCSLAGHEAAGQEAPAAAPTDQQPEAQGPGLEVSLHGTLQEGPVRLQHEALRVLGRLGLRLPSRLLPVALELGRRSVPLRTPLASVLGERGRWLAAANEAWRYAAGRGGEPGLSEDSGWTHGSLEQRAEFLRHERAVDPAAARARLQGELSSLPARERAELVRALSVGLGPDDEPMLEGLRGDRSREVRQEVLTLLVRLPTSAHAARAAARVQALMSHDAQGWRIEAPQQAEDGWKADAVDPVRPAHESLGERAWWLFQLVRQVPLNWWTGHTGLTPAGLLTWAGASDWKVALLRGWREMLSQAADPDWCDAWLDAPPAGMREDPAQLLALLPRERRERHWERQLHAKRASLHTLAHQMLSACPPGEHLSAALSAALAQAVHAALGGAAHTSQHTLRYLLPELGCVLDAVALPVLEALRPADDAPPAFTDSNRTLNQVISVRRALQGLAGPGERDPLSSVHGDPS